MSKCSIMLDENDSGIFYAGQTLKGYVELNLPKAKNCRGLRLTIDGEAKFLWTEQQGSTSVWFEDREQYLNNICYLFGCEDGETEKIEAGVHIYHFSCFLPSELPSSVDSFYGSIRYQIEAKLFIPWEIDDKISGELKIGRIDDLNLYPDLKMPLQEDDIMTNCCGGSKSLSLEASIPYSGYTSGDTINVTIKVINDSNKTVPKCQIELLQRTKYIFHGKKKVDHNYLNEVMVKVEAQGVKKKKTAFFKKQLVIPSNLTNSNELFCKILQISYEIRVTCITKGCSFSPKVYIPITLGTIPLFFDEEFQPRYLLENASNCMPPPSFEQAMNQNETNLEADEEQIQLN